MRNKLSMLALFICLVQFIPAQSQPVKRFLNLKTMKGASFALLAKDVNSGEILYSYDENRQLTPASVLKLVTASAALELLGEDYRFVTKLEYDGKISNGVLEGNLYIKGGGDPTLGSSHFAADRSRYTPDQNTFMPQWIEAISKAGIRKITGTVIADESIFDTEGISLKWMQEDIGSYYGAGSYGLSVFDNLYRLYLKTGTAGSKPEVIETIPPTPNIRFHNYMRSASVRTDSSFVIGFPYSNDRYLYGVVPAGRERFLLRGDIPDPPLFLAEYVHTALTSAGIQIEGTPSCYRLLAENKKWPTKARKELASTYSPTLREIVRIVNERSHNLYTDAIIKTLGLKYTPKQGEVLSSMNKGIQVVHEHWKQKGFDISSLWMYDGCGLSAVDKVTASFICDLLAYMHKTSKLSDAFVASLPKAGQEGSVANFLKGTSLQGRALLKSGGMSRVRAYAGYITKDDKQYAVALFVNNYSGEAQAITKNIEKLLLALF
ncbi:D-alanyl-D-alanine carboxypeptidase/D-alanyl-D-alanine-endopeptidase (penicillin-binding protein 4) [Parabacteroides sp. PF5-5]|uniref:D-alanyl-D-alanine carboxypeptidase/D-alanyl-D-alanine endopeptidase n=1 Tax=unclassified Parabacteroides TaxID=2649774 RepID=UPI00247387F1|nr:MULTISPECIES: D-alanyl-D-alanine carboxypeptidase/D-alanyl-D-alanine-endopeptidase [unclassified Parabacteroides]MDH6306766.1 D-alanyl-D-alanine carboxypeptidase/D-alanyl-D-alanine-endopeptidase (penicillin-binding protein 4) [Parabacteroides sp. PH5-39]MDH6317652.1 D-alanyl-D-alanine carboxypeptidase/D-alanyl-D-alanine-endopeptidase (penicillin-binding protein 4) [Parabacteroides sp. PF5-13]MDH6321478.1 D-alanyl-D-alanine carboxypeptidase/D-alanyl-D-alanine-endopeptidase (penicillin-binding 